MKLKEAIEQLKNGLAGVVEPHEAQAMIRVICEDVFNYDPVDVALRQESELPEFAQDKVADIIARLRFRSSIFELGNGNPGMANVARSLGRNAAIACLAGDILKVVAAVLVCRALFPGELPPLVRGWACIGATLGHDFPVWHGFRGGKGVTTLSSALALIDWRGALVAALVAAAAVYLTGYLSIAAVAAAGVFVIWAALLLPAEAILLAALVFALALYGQWSNLRGIGDGTAKRDLKRR